MGVVEGCPEEVAQEVDVEGVVNLGQDITLCHHHQLIITNDYQVCCAISCVSGRGQPRQGVAARAAQGG